MISFQWITLSFLLVSSALFAYLIPQGPSFVRNLGLPLQRSSNRNREFNAWSQEHKDNPGVCQDYQGKIEQRRGKVVSANK